MGYLPRSAPIGFRNGRDDAGKPILVPDLERWRLIRLGFLRQMTGQFTVPEVVKWLAKEGLRTERGHPLSHQQWTKMCRSPVYGGYICEEWTEGKRVEAKFPGPLTHGEWEDLQVTLHPETKTTAKKGKKALNPEFPPEAVPPLPVLSCRRARVRAREEVRQALRLLRLQES